MSMDLIKPRWIGLGRIWQSDQRKIIFVTTMRPSEVAMPDGPKRKTPQTMRGLLTLSCGDRSSTSVAVRLPISY